MDALLLAGGYGTRLRPLTYTRPKPLLPVAGRPMIEWVLDKLPPEVTRVVVAVNWQAEKLEAYFAGSERKLEFVVVRESEPMGTAGAVKNCEAQLTSDRFFVLNADVISDMDLSALTEQHSATGAVGTISLKQVPLEDVVNYGVIQPDSSDGRRIRGFVEKPKTPELAPSQLINAGAYLLERSVLDLIPAGIMVSMEKEIFPHLLDGGFYGCEFKGEWIDVGDPARLLAASARLSKDWHGAGAQIHASAKVSGSVAGDNLVVGPAATVTGCVLGDGVAIAPDISLSNCVVGDGETVIRSQKNIRIWTKPLPAGYPDKQVGNAL